eukprot:7087929-Lingulodinium_polyedra.AAC.1
MSHLTKTHMNDVLKIESIHAEQFAMLGIVVCTQCTKPRSQTSAQCPSAMCGTRRTQTRPARIGDTLY